MTKIGRNKSVLVSCSGLAVDCTKLIEWVRTGMKGKFPKLEEDSVGAIFTPKYKLYVELDSLFLLEAPFVAFGSGRGLALGAMSMGATASQAVRLAAEIDCYTNNEIDILTHEADPVCDTADRGSGDPFQKKLDHEAEAGFNGVAPAVLSMWRAPLDAGCHPIRPSNPSGPWRGERFPTNAHRLPRGEDEERYQRYR